MPWAAVVGALPKCFFRLISDSLLVLDFAFLSVHLNLKAFASAVCILGIISPWLVLGLVE